MHSGGPSRSIFKPIKESDPEVDPYLHIDIGDPKTPFIEIPIDRYFTSHLLEEKSLDLNFICELWNGSVQFTYIDSTAETGIQNCTDKYVDIKPQDMLVITASPDLAEFYNKREIPVVLMDAPDQYILPHSIANSDDSKLKVVCDFDRTLVKIDDYGIIKMLLEKGKITHPDVLEIIAQDALFMPQKQTIALLQTLARHPIDLFTQRGYEAAKDNHKLAISPAEAEEQEVILDSTNTTSWPSIGFPCCPLF